MRINEIYQALNGEGVHAGTPVTLIRTQGCNLDCTYCDTKYAQLLDEGFLMTPEEVAERAPRAWGRALITGGEPLLQSDLIILVRALHARGIEVEIETNGSIAPPAWWREVDCWSADIKCPSSSMDKSSRRQWLGTRDCDQAKFVVASPEDLVYAWSVFQHAARHAPTILISPAYPWTPEWLQKCTEFCLRSGARLSLQQHKIVYGERRGV